ncbi:hypothetical protein [Metabacillus halosaccharovorans]|uniref:hypothetical protein n=1 Tax=Metabacillus halosaccharovorans TaxID=930124 RepID=UPI00203C4F5B|nr:hypothetical protein [Metabacillus halosaccharovorans]MCM3442108.1 hypothetical protein [Metabacillus halosaccharovorans]
MDDSKKKQSIHNPVKSYQIDNDVYEANMEIQERFYENKRIEDDIDVSLSNNSNIGAVLLPEDK